MPDNLETPNQVAAEDKAKATAEPAPKGSDSAKAPAAADDSAFDVTLDTFCLAKSKQKGVSVELLHGFYADELSKGFARASRVQFERRYADFANRVVD
jgi:hypothetical protein